MDGRSSFSKLMIEVARIPDGGVKELLGKPAVIGKSIIVGLLPSNRQVFLF